MLFTAKSSVLLDKEEDGRVDDEEDETCCCVSSTDRDACMPESFNFVLNYQIIKKTKETNKEKKRRRNIPGYLVDSSGCLEEDMAREDFSDLS